MEINFMYLDWLRKLAAGLPEVSERKSYGTPGFFVRRKLMMRLKEDGETLAIYTEDRDVWITKKPATFFFTDHYRNYPMVLVRLNKVTEKDLKALMLEAWKMRATPKMIRDLDKK